MPSLPQSLLVRQAFSNPSSLKQCESPGHSRLIHVEQDQVWEYLNKLDVHKSMSPEGMGSQALMELDKLIARPLRVIFERAWRSQQGPKDLSKSNVTPLEGEQEGGSVELQAGQPHIGQQKELPYVPHYRLAAKRLESSFAEKDPSILVDTKSGFQTAEKDKTTRKNITRKSSEVIIPL